MNGNCCCILRHLLTYNIHGKYIHVKVVDCSSWGNDKKIYFGTHQCIGLYENISLIIFLFPTNLEEKPISFVVKHFNFCCCCVGLIRFNQWTLSLA